MNNKLPLFVDLDGTIIKEDIGQIAFKKKINDNILNLFVIIFKFIFFGKTKAKLYISQDFIIDINTLTFNKTCLDYIDQQKSLGRKIFLISGSHIILVNQFKTKLKNFDEFYGTHKNYNMVSYNKVKFIREKLGFNSFDYIGNSYQDLSVWENSENIIYTNVTKSLLDKINLIDKKKVYLNEIF